MPRRTDIPLRFSANISTRDATTMTRSKIFQPLSKYLQKKTELSNVLYSFRRTKITLGQHLQTTKSILYEKLWHPMFSRLFCFDVWFWFNAGIRRAGARFWREISNCRNTNFTGNGKITVQEFPVLFFSIKTYSLDKANNLRAASAVKKVVKTLFPISRTCLSSGLIPWCSAAKKAVFKMIHMVTADSKSMSWVTRNMKFWNLTHGW